MAPAAIDAVTASGLTADVVAMLRGPLSDLGFRKRSGEVFTYDVADGVFGWLGLNRAYRHGEDRLEVNPVAGVRHQEVERLVAELRGRTFHPYQPPTVSTPLTYLTPAGRYKPWLFDRQAAMNGLAGDLVAAVRDCGLPFMRGAASLAALGRLIEQGTGIADQLVYRRPVVSLLQGDLATSDAALEAALADLGNRTDAAAAEFRSFADRLRERLDQAS